MILLMMVDTPEEKRKFVILYENYRYLMLKVAADILHDSLKTNWSAVAGGASKSDEAALYAEYAIDFAALAMRYALLATATALDMQYEEERNKDE